MVGILDSLRLGAGGQKEPDPLLTPTYREERELEVEVPTSGQWCNQRPSVMTPPSNPKWQGVDSAGLVHAERCWEVGALPYLALSCSVPTVRPL
jgi:hypothetical protein